MISNAFFGLRTFLCLKCHVSLIQKFYNNTVVTKMKDYYFFVLDNAILHIQKAKFDNKQYDFP